MTSLLENLQTRGFAPNDDVTEPWFDLRETTNGKLLRVIIEETRLTVCGFNRYMYPDWTVNLDNTPRSLVTATLDSAAEWLQDGHDMSAEPHATGSVTICRACADPAAGFIA